MWHNYTQSFKLFRPVSICGDPMPELQLRHHLEKLRILHAIGRAGTLTGTGKLLNMTQPAVTHALKSLEQSLSVRLVTRSASGVEWTEAGELLYRYSLRLFDEVDAVERQLSNRAGVGAGASLRVGTHETLAIHVWPMQLEAFARRRPEIAVAIISGRVTELVRRLINRDFHLLLTVAPMPRAELVVETIYEGRLQLFAAHDRDLCRRGPYPLLAKETLSVEEANQVPVLTDRHSHLREGVSITSGLIESGFTIEKVHELNSFEAAISMAQRGLGLAALPDRNAQAAVARRELRPIPIDGLAPDALGRYAICATYLKAEAETAARDLLLDQLRALHS